MPRTPFSLATALLAAAALSGAAGFPRGAGAQTAPRDRPSFERLIKFNEAELFGGRLNMLSQDRFEVTFDADGQMVKGFEGPGIMDTKSPGMQGASRKFIILDKEVLYPNLACIGMSPPNAGWCTWTSRFPVAGNPKVTFDLRLPGLVTSQSSFLARLNLEGKNYLETSYFNVIEKKAHGKVLAKRDTPIKEYAPHFMKWFPRNKKEGIPVEMSVEGDKLKVMVNKKEIVSMDKVSDVPQGKVSFGFRKIVFTMQNLKVSGKIDRAWCEGRLAELEKAGKLLLKDPAELPPLPLPGDPPPAAGAGEEKKPE